MLHTYATLVDLRDSSREVEVFVAVRSLTEHSAVVVVSGIEDPEGGYLLGDTFSVDRARLRSTEDATQPVWQHRDGLVTFADGRFR